MGIVKIRHQVSVNVVPEKRSSIRAEVGEPLVEDERKDDFEDCELMEEAGCELYTVGGQTCSIPYELYELPDLKGILSLDSWNSLLTEEERFSLASYLPDMDQETFCLTMSDLLSGGDLFFGSPLEQLFRRMKTGFYSPEAAEFRECLDGLQRLKNYYSLRSYHESMRRKLLEMRRVWSDCHQPNATVEEKVCIWNKTKPNNKRVLRVDLNASPGDEDMLNKDEVVAIASPPAKIACWRSRASRFPSDGSIGLAEYPKPKTKGLLKIKPDEMNRAVRPSLSNTSGRLYGPVPKGVLKIKPKANIFVGRSELEEMNGASLLEENRKPGCAASGRLQSSPEGQGRERFVRHEEPTNPSAVVFGIPESKQSSQDFPVTYERNKKAFAKLSDGRRSSIKRSRGAADSEQTEGRDCCLAGRIKPLKIKIKAQKQW